MYEWRGPFKAETQRSTQVSFVVRKLCVGAGFHRRRRIVRTGELHATTQPLNACGLNVITSSARDEPCHRYRRIGRRRRSDDSMGVKP